MSNNDNLITIDIDGQSLQVEQGQMIIEAADKANIGIPRFCYHKKLMVAANCRMCLVEVEKAPKPLPACATPVTDGMVVRTRSSKALAAQKAVMEFLLINHPLDCPICDQGGQCELQDVSMGFGKDVSRYTEGKRAIDDEDLGPLVATDMTRCIQCTRCVRFGEEITGLRELGAIGRGEHMHISTYVKKSLTSEMSGNIIDLCPVGALTSKPFRFKARAWELIQAPSIAAHDCVGSHVNVHRRGQQVMRVVPREEEALNETWLSDRDRFSYEGVNSSDRLMQPKIKRNGVWETVDWIVALDTVARGLDKVLKEKGPQQIGAIASPNSTVEALYLLQKLMRELGVDNVDHRLHQTDFSHSHAVAPYPGLPCSIADIENQEAIVLIGSHLGWEQPIINHRVRKASLSGAHVSVINPMDYAFNFDVATKMVRDPSQLVHSLAAVAKALLDKGANGTAVEGMAGLLVSVEVSAPAREIAEQLLAAEKGLLLIGALGANHPQASLIRTMATCIAHLSGAQVGELTEGANAAGAWLAGMVPHHSAAGAVVNKPGLDIKRLFESKLSSYVLLNVEPGLDCANPAMALNALQQADFNVVLTAYDSPEYEDFADVMLPVTPTVETAGTFVNVEGRWQSFDAVVKPLGEARPAWKILRVLANTVGFDHFAYTQVEDVRDEVRFLVDGMKKEAPVWRCPSQLTLGQQSNLQRITEWPLYRGDSVVRRAQSLQACASHMPLAIHCSPQVAERLQLKSADRVMATQGEHRVTLPLVVDKMVPDNCVYIPAGYEETQVLGSSFGNIKIERCQ